MPKRLILFGDRTAAEIEAVAVEVYSHEFSRIDRFYVDPSDEALNGIEPLVDRTKEEICYAIGVLDGGLRQRVEQACIGKGFRPWSIIHPSAYIAASAKIGQGCFIAPLAAVGLDAVIGDHSLVHFHASIGHNAVLGKHCAVLPGARISGHVELQEGVMVGSNAFIFQGTKVGRSAKIDALTYVRSDVPAGRIVSVRRPNA
jgi:acetyltransferase-like isoleucine patch superfamily enzyme